MLYVIYGANVGMPCSGELYTQTCTCEWLLFGCDLVPQLQTQYLHPYTTVRVCVCVCVCWAALLHSGPLHQSFQPLLQVQHHLSLPTWVCVLQYASLGSVCNPPIREATTQGYLRWNDLTHTVINITRCPHVSSVRCTCNVTLLEQLNHTQSYFI